MPDSWIPKPNKWVDDLPRSGPAGPLPRGLKADGRPVWEPPILDYSELIDEEYEQKRRAFLEWTGGDVAKTTWYLDTSFEHEMLKKFSAWTFEQMDDNRTRPEAANFFEGLAKEIWIDHWDVLSEWNPNSVDLRRKEDGTYHVVEFPARTSKANKDSLGAVHAGPTPDPELLAAASVLFDWVYTLITRMGVRLKGMPSGFQGTTMDGSTIRTARQAGLAAMLPSKSSLEASAKQSLSTTNTLGGTTLPSTKRPDEAGIESAPPPSRSSQLPRINKSLATEKAATESQTVDQESSQPADFDYLTSEEETEDQESSRPADFDYFTSEEETEDQESSQPAGLGQLTTEERTESTDDDAPNSPPMDLFKLWS